MDTTNLGTILGHIRSNDQPDCGVKRDLMLVTGNSAPGDWTNPFKPPSPSTWLEPRLAINGQWLCADSWNGTTDHQPIVSPDRQRPSMTLATANSGLFRYVHQPRSSKFGAVVAES
ncbi:hypothetical protein RSAG8_06758, partial [Rhizoctonia solani AG-8 WAC10335]